MGSKLNDISRDVWTFLTEKGEVKVPKLYKKFKEQGRKKENVKKAIKRLQRVSLIEFNDGNDSKDPFIKRKEILGEKIKFFPCLGCQSLEKCGVGENYSPENCEELSFWFKSLVERDDGEET